MLLAVATIEYGYAQAAERDVSVARRRYAREWRKVNGDGERASQYEESAYCCGVIAKWRQARDAASQRKRYGAALSREWWLRVVVDMRYEPKCGAYECREVAASAENSSVYAWRGRRVICPA